MEDLLNQGYYRMFIVKKYYLMLAQRFGHNLSHRMFYYVSCSFPWFKSNAIRSSDDFRDPFWD